MAKITGTKPWQIPLNQMLGPYAYLKNEILASLNGIQTIINKTLSNSTVSNCTLSSNTLSSSTMTSSTLSSCALSSITFSGSANTVPTPTAGDSSTQIANTAFITSAILNSRGRTMFMANT